MSARTVTLLRQTVTETFEYDRDAVVRFARDHDLDKDWMSEDDVILEVFTQTNGSQFGDERLFSSLADMDAGYELSTRSEDA